MEAKYGALSFSSYTAAERAADHVIHCIGVPLSILAALSLLYRSLGAASIVIISIAAYLVGMVSASAAYQLSAPGTYTPFSVNVFHADGVWLCVLLWALAAIGIFLSLRYPRRLERLLLGVYLMMGWMLLVMLRECFSILSPAVLALIIAGGVVYTLALLWHISVDGFRHWRITVRTSPRRRPCEEIEDRVSDCRHGGLRRRSFGSFFSVPLL